MYTFGLNFFFVQPKKMNTKDSGTHGAQGMSQGLAMKSDKAWCRIGSLRNGARAVKAAGLSSWQMQEKRVTATKGYPLVGVWLDKS